MDGENGFYSYSQASTQGLKGTQEVDSQTFDQSLCDESVWGRLLSVRRKIKVFDLIKEHYKFGRGDSTSYQFTGELFDSKVLTTLSKLHFQIYREQKEGLESVVVLEDTSQNGTFVNKVLIGKKNKKVLQSNDEIALTAPHNKVFVFYDCLNNDANNYPKSLTEKYTMTKKLGDGTYGEVRLAYAHGSLERAAIKIVKKRMLSTNGTTFRLNLNQINNEIHLLQSVDHPCIVKLLDMIEGPEKIYIVMELAGGGELFDRISRNGKLKEPIAKMYFYQLVHAIKYLHKKKITHRDIKPENILLDSDEEYARIKLTDFGLSKLTDDASFMTSLCGTPNYIAPELLVLEEGLCYTSKVDMWSLGVVLFVCLAGYAPFQGKTDAETKRNILTAKYLMRAPFWDAVSEEAKDLVKELLVVDPKVRLNAQQVLKHQWLDDPEMLRRAHAFMDLPSSSDMKRPLDMSDTTFVDSKVSRLTGDMDFGCI